MKRLLCPIQLILGLAIFFGIGYWGPIYATEQRWRPLVENLQQHPHDQRAYQAIQLNNGMKVLLVSDPQAPRSMTAVGLPVGSLQDPDAYLGLVHYLEHMLFLGSENYPEGIEVQGHSAGTSGNSTIFTAAAQHPWLAITLERLADALAYPNFDPHLAEKERHSVHQEALGHRTEDYRRIYQINKETLNPHHPFSRFSVGNLDTLADKKPGSLREAVQKFHRRYYSADIMVAVIYSNQPLVALAHLAAESYGRIPSHKPVITPITIPLATARQQGVTIHYVPANVYEALQVDFVIPIDRQDVLHSKSNYYLDRVITGRGPGTLADWLQQQGLANGLSVSYHFDMAGNAGLFSIHIHPTENGMKQQDLILAGVFRYLQLIKQQGIQHRYFEEMGQQLKMSSVDFSAQRNLHYVVSLTDHLLYYPIEQVLTLDSLTDRYRPGYLQRRLSQMVPQKARIWVASSQAPYDKQAYFVEAPYQLRPLSQQQIIKWQQLGRALTFNLPKLNPYLPTDFTVMPVKRLPKKPELVWKAPGGRAWLTPSHYFSEQPKVNITLLLRNPPAMKGVRNDMLAWVFSKLLDINLKEFFYWASDAGVNIQISRNDEGLAIWMAGFHQNLSQLLEEMVTRCQQIIFDKSQLEQVKYEIKQILDSIDKRAPRQQAIRPISCLWDLSYATAEQRCSQLATITLQDIEAYRSQLFKPAMVDILAIGNMSKAQLQQLAKTLYNRSGTKQQKYGSNPTIAVHKTEKALLHQTTMVDGHALSALYIPRGYDRLSSQANARLLRMLLETWFFDQLRTQEQLGYSVDVSTKTVAGKTGLQFTVQSANHSPEALYARYQTFYQQAWQQLQKLKEKREFAAWQRGLLKGLREKLSSLSDEADSWYADWLNERFDFDSNDRLIARVKALTADEVLEFYRQAILEPTGLALLSQVKGKTVVSKPSGSATAAAFAAPEGWKFYPSIAALQQQLIKSSAPH
ncbi:MAG: pitrilysin [Candidatus Symbiodolus clandestinus]